MLRDDARRRLAEARDRDAFERRVLDRISEIRRNRDLNASIARAPDAIHRLLAFNTLPTVQHDVIRPHSAQRIRRYEVECDTDHTSVATTDRLAGAGVRSPSPPRKKVSKRGRQQVLNWAKDRA